MKASEKKAGERPRQLVQRVRSYERGHRNRAGVMTAAERELARA
jgi:hypothetical protein